MQLLLLLKKTALVVCFPAAISMNCSRVFWSPKAGTFKRVVDNQDALSLARTKPFDLIITGTQGPAAPEDIDFLRKIRSARPHLRLIILTDQWTPGDIIEAMA